MLNNIWNELADLREDIEIVTDPYRGLKGWRIWFNKLEDAESKGPNACTKLLKEIDELIEVRGPGPYEMIKLFLPDNNAEN